MTPGRLHLSQRDTPIRDNEKNLDWRKRPDIDVSEAISLVVDGDPNVLLFTPQRFLPNAFILTAGRTALEAQIPKHTKAQQAAFFVAKSTLHLGLLPNPDERLFGYLGNEEHLALGMPIDRKPFVGGLGLWVRDSQLLLPATDIDVVRPKVQVSDFSERFPHVTFVPNRR